MWLFDRHFNLVASEEHETMMNHSPVSLAEDSPEVDYVVC